MGRLNSNIYTFRKANHMSMEELGKRIGTTKATIQKYESGEIKNIPYDRILELADALEVSPVVLMGLENNNSENRLTKTNAGSDFVLIEKFSRLKDTDKVIIMNMIDSLLEKDK